MKHYITRAWADGTDFIGTAYHRKTGVKAGRSGMGDMICEVSNLYAQGGPADVLCEKVHPAIKTFLSLINEKHSQYEWLIDPYTYRKIVSKSKDLETQEQISDRKILHCYPEFDYIKLDRNKFVKTELPSEEYATVQTVPFAKKCNYTIQMMENVKKQYNIKIVEVGGQEKLGLKKLAYIIDNAKFHIGIDSGMSHFAHCIKEKKDVHLYVPRDRITGVTYRWINQGYNVNLI